MSHFVRECTDQDWYRGLKIPHTVIRNIDEKTKKAVSGTGGAYAPSSAIIIGGAGMEFQCAVQLTGATANPGAGKVFRFGANDYFKNEALVSRAIHDSPLLLGLDNQALQREARPWLPSTGLVAPSLRMRRPLGFVRMPIRPPDGSRIASVEVGFRIGQSHANVPAIMPKVRVVRIDASGIVKQLPGQNSSLFDPDGWISLTRPASGALYYAAGAVQTITPTFDYANNDPVDTSLYGYAVEWTEEGGSNTYTDSLGNHLVYLKTTIYQADLRPY